jgi:glycosyltransferase involved in cell wall biosynthesis
MPVLWISKRRYMHKDLLSDRFGRYYELPLHLSEAGIDIDMVLLNYRWRDGARVRINNHLTIRSYGILGAVSMLRYLLARASAEDIRTILGSADMPYCILAVLIAKLTGRSAICDIYDNFETYSSARIPLMVPLFYRSLRGADAVITFEQTLTDHLRDAHGIAAICSVPNGVDPDVFHPRDRRQCRDRLGIPPDVPVIGYFGSLNQQRGAGTLFEAFNHIASAVPESLFLMAGSIEDGITLPALNIRHLGLLPQNQLPEAICASDVCTIFYADNAFARFSFPQKMMEYIACGVPFVTPAAGGVPAYLPDYPGHLYCTGDASSLAEVALAMLARRHVPLPPVWTWAQAADRFAACLARQSITPTK